MSDEIQVSSKTVNTEEDHIESQGDGDSPALTEEDMLKIFVGPNSDKFVDIYRAEQTKSQAKFMSRFNFVVMLFPTAWFFYRKLYLIGVGVLLFPFILITIFPALSEISMAGGAGALAVLGNSLYVWFALKRIKKLKDQNINEDELKERLASMGGTSPVGAAFGALILASLIALPFIEAETASIPKCSDVQVQELAGNILTDNMKRNGADSSELSVSDFKEIKRTDDSKQLCSFVAKIKDEQKTVYAAVTWMDKDIGQYQVQIFSDLREISKQ